MFAVGVGAYLNNEELRDIASQPTCTHVFNLPTFDDVFGLVQAAKVMACKGWLKFNVSEYNRVNKSVVVLFDILS